MRTAAFAALFLAMLPAEALQPAALAPHASTVVSCRRRARVPLLLNDEELMASLRARLQTTEPPPLGIEDVGAESMGPSDVINHVMDAMARGDLTTLLGFSVKDGGALEDTLGQMNVGAFGSPEQLKTHLAAHERYSTLTVLAEWKPMGKPDMSNMSRKAAQKLLVRRDGGNWEDFFINLQLAEAQVGGWRWLITSIYKQGVAQ